MHKLKILFKSLEIISKQAFITGTFLLEWNKGNIVPIFKKKKKNGKENIKNYSPVTLLPICGKIFERVIFIFVGLAPKGLMKCSVL